MCTKHIGSFIFFALLVFITLVVYPVFAKNTEENASLSLYEKANQTYTNRLSEGFSEKALAQYEEFLETNPNHVGALWRAARTSWWIGQHTKSKAEKALNFQRGIDLAQKAVSIDPDSAEAHFTLAGSYGSFGETKGIFKSLKLLKPMREALEEVIRIDPDFDEGAAYRVQGILEYKVPGIMGGNKKEAEKLLLQAYQYNDKNPYHLYYMGEYYKVTREYDKATKYLNNLLSISKQALTNVTDEADLTYMQEEARALIRQIK